MTRASEPWRFGGLGRLGRFACGKGRYGRYLARYWWMIAIAALGILAATIAIQFLV